MKKILIHIIVVIMICINCNAQEIYGVVPSTVSSQFDVYKLNPDTSLSFVFDFNPSVGCNDIAISPSGTFYGIGNPGIIYEIDTANGTTTELAQPLYPQVSVALCCDNNNNLYAINGSGILTKYNILTGISDSIADLGDCPTGDLTFYKGNLIFQSTDGNIKAYNIEDQTLVNIFCSIECTIDTTLSYCEFWGSSNFFENCSTETIIAFSNTGDIYEIDFINQMAINLNVNNTVLSNSCFMGSASSTEHFALNCTSYQFTNINCGTVLAEEVELNLDIDIFPNPVVDVVNVKAISVINCVEIYNMQGRMMKKVVFPKNEIDLSELNEGVYLIKIKSNDTVYVKKLIKTPKH